MTEHEFFDIANCARCGRDHKAVEFHPFTRPIGCDDLIFTHFGTCPVTQEPILLRKENDIVEKVSNDRT